VGFFYLFSFHFQLSAHYAKNIFFLTLDKPQGELRVYGLKHAVKDQLFLLHSRVKTTTIIDRNVVQKEAEKKLKYKNLGIETQRMWNLKCTIIPVIIGATVIVRKSLRKNLEAMPGKYSTDSLQKTAVLATSHIIQKVLQC
jgi:hypothetical protein